MTRMLDAAFFAHKRDNHPRPCKVTWDGLAKRLMSHEERDEKDGPLWSPTRYIPGSFRCNNGVAAIDAAVGDFDDGVAWDEVKDRLQQYEYVAHSTFSFDPEHPKFRVVVPFSAEVPREDWGIVKPRIDQHVFGLQCDPAAKDASRVYYLPSCPPGALRFAEHHKGAMLDPTALAPATARPGNGAADLPAGPVLPLGKAALNFVANGAPLRQQRARAVAAARNYLSAGYTVDETAAALWRGLQISPQEPGKEPWTDEDARAIARDIAAKPGPPLEVRMDPFDQEADFEDAPEQAPAAAVRSLWIDDATSGCTMRRLGLGYCIQFPLHGVKLTIDQLRRSGGELRGEVLVESTAPTTPPHLFWGSLILSSGANREKLAKTLEKRTAGLGIGWDNITEVVCRKVALEERAGEAFTTAGGSASGARETSWLVRNFAPLLEPTTIFGDGGTGKSYVALAVAVSVKSGREIIPGFSPAVSGNVLYLDWEASRDRLDSRINRLCKGAGIEPVCIGYRRCSMPLSEQVEEVMRYCQSEGVVLVIVDSVEMAIAGTGGDGGNPNDKVVILHSALRLLGTTTLLIDHINAFGRTAATGAGKPIGGVFKTNLVRMAFEMRKGTESNRPGESSLGLFNVKRNDDGPLLKAVGLKAIFTPDSTSYERDGISDPALTKCLSTRERLVLALQKHHLLSNKEAAAITDSTQTAVDAAFSRGQGAVFAKVGDKWGLVARQDAAVTTGYSPEDQDEIPF